MIRFFYDCVGIVIWDTEPQKSIEGMVKSHSIYPRTGWYNQPVAPNCYLSTRIKVGWFQSLDFLLGLMPQLVISKLQHFTTSNKGECSLWFHMSQFQWMSSSIQVCSWCCILPYSHTALAVLRTNVKQLPSHLKITWNTYFPLLTIGFRSTTRSYLRRLT